MKVSDVLLPMAKEWGTYDGKFVEVPYTLTVFGIWYSQKLFKQKGWQVPKTWDEFVKLCDKIKAAGMAPYTFAGKYPQYQTDPLISMAVKTGGLDVVKNIDNLEDGAWKVDAMKQSAARWQEIGRKYLLQGTAGISHTESQTKQNNGEVAMLPCGSWLENEQKDSTPKGFDYGMFPVPSMTASDKLPQNAVRAHPQGNFFVSAKSKNPRGGMEYLRTMLSKEGATKYTEMVSSLTVVKDAKASNPTPGLKAASDAFDTAGKNTFNWRFEDWYKELFDETKSACGELMAGRATPDAFCDRIQKKADEIKKDSSVKKFHR
jgi:N-acetylglucosamine transport system substrate-binding protein